MSDLRLPLLPDGMEWVVHAESDRFTVHIALRPPKAEASGELIIEDDSHGSEDKTNASGYVRSYTRRHSIVITRKAWEEEVYNAARDALTSYEEANRHAVWADEIMRRSR